MLELILGKDPSPMLFLVSMILDSPLLRAPSTMLQLSTSMDVKYTFTKLLLDHRITLDIISLPSKIYLQTLTTNLLLLLRRDRLLKEYTSHPLLEHLKSRYRWSTILLRPIIRTKLTISMSMALISQLSSSIALSQYQGKTTSSWWFLLLPPLSTSIINLLLKSLQFQWIMSHSSLSTSAWAIRTTIISSSIFSRAVSLRWPAKSILDKCTPASRWRSSAQTST